LNLTSVSSDCRRDPVAVVRVNTRIPAILGS
jgi:hypothetical protein